MHSAFGVDHGSDQIAKLKIGSLPKDPGMRAAGWARQLTADSSALKSAGKTKKTAVKGKKWGDLTKKPENGLKWDMGANYGAGTGTGPNKSGGLGTISGKKKSFKAWAAPEASAGLGAKASNAWASSKNWMGQHKVATGAIGAGGAGAAGVAYTGTGRRR